MAPIRRQVQVVNALGLHLRAADKFVRLAQRFQAEIRIQLNGKSGNGKSILDLTSLVAECGTRLELEASGSDAEGAIAALSRLIEDGFHETDHGQEKPPTCDGSGPEAPP